MRDSSLARIVIGLFPDPRPYPATPTIKFNRTRRKAIGSGAGKDQYQVLYGAPVQLRTPLPIPEDSYLVASQQVADADKRETR